MATQRYNYVILVLLLFIMMIGGCKLQKEASSQEYPSKPITAIVPFAAGGAADMMVRNMEKVSVKYIGQPLVINNMPGGGGTIGWNNVVQAKPDGYTISYVSSGALLQPLYGTTRFNYRTSLEPLVQVYETPVLMVVSEDSPWNSINDVINSANDHPGQLKFGHSGIGSANHIFGELFAVKAGIQIAQVPFSGESEALAALLGGHIQIMFASISSILDNVKAGKVKILAVAGEKRLTNAECSSVLTFKEQGLDLVFTMWQGIAVPKMMPEEIKQKLAAALKDIVNDPDYKRNLEVTGVSVEYLDPGEFKKKWNYEGERLEKMIKETGILDKIAAQKK